MPRPAPSSVLVSEIADATPARSGGAAPTIRSVPRAAIGPMPAPIRTGSRDHDAPVRSRADQSEQRQADGRDDQAARDDEARTDLCRESRCRHGADHQPGRVGQRPQAGLQRGESMDQLEVLQGEELRAGHDEDADGEKDGRDAERTLAEQLEVDQRVGERLLPTDEGASDDQAEHHEHAALPADAVFGHQLEAVDDRQHGDQGQQGADEVQPARTRCPGARAAAPDRGPAESP